MPGGTTEVGGNTKLQQLMGQTITTPSVTANTSVVMNFALQGALPYDLIDVQSQSHTPGLSIGSSYCTTANTMTVQFINSTGSTIGAVTNYQIIISLTRLENANLGFSFFPSALV